MAGGRNYGLGIGRYGGVASMEENIVYRWVSTRCLQRATVMLQSPGTVPHLYLLLRGFEPQTFSLLPPELSCPLIYKMQQLYIYLISL